MVRIEHRHIKCSARLVRHARPEDGGTKTEGRDDESFPMEEIAIDPKGLFPESDDGNRCVLVLVDGLSKWMEVYAVPNTEAKTIAEKLVM